MGRIGGSAGGVHVLRLATSDDQGHNVDARSARAQEALS